MWGIEKFGVEALIGEEYINTEEVNTLVDWLSVQIDSAVKNKHHEVSLEAMSDVLNKLLNTELKKRKNNLVKKLFNSKNADIGKLEIKLEDLKESILHCEIEENSGELKVYVNNQQRAFSITIGKMFWKKNQKIGYLLQEVR